MEHEDQDIEFVDFTGKTMEEAEEIDEGVDEGPLQDGRIPSSRGVVMIKMPDGFSGVYFLGHHMIVDAQSLIAFLKDIIELYCNAKYEGVPYPKDMASYIEQIQKDLAYEAGSKAQQRDASSLRRRSRKASRSLTGINGTDKLEAAREMFKNPELRTAFSAS